MAERRRGLGRGIGALIPDNQRESKDRPFDVFFGGSPTASVRPTGSQADSDTKALEDENGLSNEGGKVGDATESQQSFLDLLGIASPGKDGERNEVAKPATSSQSKTVRRGKVAKPAVESVSELAGDSTDKGAGPTTDGAIEPDPESGVVDGDKTATEHPMLRDDLDAPIDPLGSEARDDEKFEAGEGTRTDDAAVLTIVSAPDSVNGSEEENRTAEAGESSGRREETAMAVSFSADHGDDGELVAVPGATYAELTIDSIVPNQRQPRTVFDEDDLEELANSIKEVGVLQPVIVRPLAAPLSEYPEARYELIMGERRLRASQLAGSDTIPALVRRTADEDLLRDALLENLHRAQLNPLEEAAAYQQLLEDFDCTQEELARRIARSRPQITNTLRLLKLPPLVQRRVAAQVLTAGHARALLGLSDAAAMERLAQRIVAENLSVRQVEELVAVGEEPQAVPVTRRRAQRYAPELGDLSGRLTDRFDTRVKVDMGIRKGTIKIDFATIEDLNRILSVMSPEIDGVDFAEESEA